MHDLIKKLREKELKLSIYLTGGGSLVIPQLLVPGGASSVISQLYMPYGMEAVHEISEGDRVKFCSANFADELAREAWLDGDCFGLDVDKHICVGATFSLFKDNQREDRANEGFICVRNNDDLDEVMVNYNGYNDRLIQEQKAAEDIILEIESFVNKHYA